MIQPLGYVLLDQVQLVCHLNKALYDLKQSPRVWFDEFSTVVLQFGF